MAQGRYIPTILDVAREAGVSKSSVARVLVGGGPTSAKTRLRVEEAAAALGYRPNALAKAMKSGSTATIGVIIPDIASPFFAAVVRGLADSARVAGFEVIIANTDDDPEIEARAIEVMAEKRVDGLVIAPARQDHPAALLRVLGDATPVVLLDRRPPALVDVPSVSVDNVGAARLATEHLLSLGHQRIGIVTESRWSFDEVLARADAENVGLWVPSSQRLLGYLLAHRDARVATDPALAARCDSTSDSAREAVRNLLDAGSVGALFCGDERLTHGAYRALVDRRMAIPDELSFVGFDDQDWTTLVTPAITVVEQPRALLGSTCADLLLAQIRGAGATVTGAQLPAALIVRGSTARV